jgi:hypothetical protein
VLFLTAGGVGALLTARIVQGIATGAAITVSYLAFSLPAAVAGVAAGVVGLRPTALVYGGVVVALSVMALVARLRLRGRAPQPA